MMIISRWGSNQRRTDISCALLGHCVRYLRLLYPGQDGGAGHLDFLKDIG